ncbi:MAG: hypothetical protein Fur006_05260 [Coleofasciculaceae cyanobacterium]
MGTYTGTSGNDIFTAHTEWTWKFWKGFKEWKSWTMYGLGGNDILTGGPKDDILYGSSGYDYLNGGDGNDYLNGGLDRDSLYGSAGNDHLRGGDGNDYLNGGDGHDTLIGNFGNDILTGGAGADHFVFSSPIEGSDTITDFLGQQNDKIFVSASGFGGGLTIGSVPWYQFTIGSSATNASHRFIYDSSSGGLFFDSDGTGNSGQVKFATLSTGLPLISSDIFVFA